MRATARFQWPTILLLALLLPACGQLPDGTPTAEAYAPSRPQLDPLPPSGEGMWPWARLGDLDEAALRKRGLEIPLADLWTPGEGGLLRGAVGLKGCSASFVSPDGLLITNHHCVFGAIQRNSTEERNLIEEGFLARSREEELDGRGTRVLVFQKHIDVSDRVLDGIPENASDLERMKWIEKREKEIVAACESEPNTRCTVSRNNDGLSFVLLEHIELRDVRLVAVPPRSLGEFGGEIDNWQWPRHTLDFALIRAYVDPEGRPAAYAAENVPYGPERHFRIGAGGVSPGDLVMVIGTPYSTARYRTLASVRADLTWYYPLRVDLFSAWLGVLGRTCDDIPATCLPTASMVKSLNNALTNARGMIAGLERAEILERKRELERRWRDWVAAEPQRKERWGGALDELSAFVEADRAGRDRDFLIRYLLWGNKIVWSGRTITKWAAEQEKPDADREPGYQDRDRENLLSDLRQAQRSYHPEADRRTLAFILERLGRLPDTDRVRAFDEALGSNYSARSIRRFSEQIYSTTRLGDEQVRTDLFGAGLATLEASNDSAVRLALALMPELDAYEERRKARSGAYSRLRPPYIESLVEMLGSRFYPDANASPRISFATVAGYSPRDGVWHTPMTTLGGLLAKVTGEEPFEAPQAVIEAIRGGERGPYADPALGDVPVCFLSNADTTGGNSGSPAIDGRGRLVGLNFDRVYENIAGDYGYNPALSRNIMVEARSILWYLDRIVHANHLLEEMGVGRTGA